MWRTSAVLALALALWALVAPVGAQTVQTLVGPTNFTAFVNCANTDAAGCSYLKQITLLSIQSCNNQQNKALIDLNNGVTCQCCTPPAATTPPTAGTIAVNSTNVTSLMTCPGFSGDQCSQLKAEATSQTIVCENQRAPAALLTINTQVVFCWYGTQGDPKQTYFSSIFNLQPLTGLTGQSLAASYVVPALQETLNFWYPYLATTNAVPTKVPQGLTGSYYYNTVQNGCGAMSGTAGPCSFHGTCNIGYSRSYCVCSPGWTGDHCDVPVVTDSSGVSCDCGINWVIASIAMFPRIAGYTLEYASSSLTGWFPVASFDQAKYVCYNMASCDGFVWYPTASGFNVALVGYKKCTTASQYGWHPAFTTSANCDPAVLDSIPMTSVLSNLGLSNAAGAFLISRTTGYACNAYTTNSIDGNYTSVRGNFIDLGWYYFSDSSRREEIDAYACKPSDLRTIAGSNTSSPDFQYCTIGLINDFSCLPNGIFTPCEPVGAINNGKMDLTQVNFVTQLPYYYAYITYIPANTTTKVLNTWATNAWRHWNEVGHKKRYSPNAQCSLYPTLWDPNTQCTQPTNGCWYSTTGGVPCGAPFNGYCTKQVGALSGSCSCNPFDSTFGALQGTQRFYGLACQSDSYFTAITPGFTSPVLCAGHGHVALLDSFPPYQVRTPTWYLPAPNQTFVSVDSGVSSCDCDGSGGYSGTYCQVSACGTCGSSSAQGICGYVTINNITIPQCKCEKPYIGNHCQIDATSIMYPIGDPLNGLLCAGAGTPLCVQTAGQVNGPNDPNCVAYSIPACLCNSGYSGTYCQAKNCPVTVLVPGQGVCSGDGTAGTCYPPYTGSAYTDVNTGNQIGACSIDNCAAWGGKVTGTGVNATCSCPYGMRTWTDGSGKASCVPECDFYQGVKCGPDYTSAQCIYTFDITGKTPDYCNQFAGTPTKCTYSTSLGLARTAKCSCTDDPAHSQLGPYPAKQSPSNSSQWVCLNRCKFNSTYVFQGDSCQCTNPAYTSTPPSLDCSTPVCYNNGTYAAGKCTCPAPWTGLRCQTSMCGDILDTHDDGSHTFNTTLPLRGTTFYGANGWQCSCNRPFGGYNSTQPTDCLNPNGVCTIHGLVHQAYEGGQYTSAFGWCDCSVLYTSNQTKFLANASQSLWSWCDVPKCQNGGSANLLNEQLCDCPVPWYSILVAGQTFSPFCTLNTCGVHGRPVSGVGCICDVSLNGIAWSNVNCTKSPCLNGGTWNSTIGCNCARGFEGAVCDIKIPCVQGTYNSSNKCACNSGWTGIYCDQLVTLLPTPAPTPTPSPTFFTRKPTPGSNSTNTTIPIPTIQAASSVFTTPFIAVLVVAAVSTAFVAYSQAGAVTGYHLLHGGPGRK